MTTIRKREIRKYRRRLHRTVALYLALKAWCAGINCIVLSRSELIKFFDMENTPGIRMSEIEKDMKPWFKGFKPYHRENNNTYVTWLFLLQSDDTSFLPPGSNLSTSPGVKKLIEGLAGGERKVILLSEILGETGVPTQRDMITELTLLTAGLMSPTSTTHIKLNS